jgi:uncharacterized membrane protein (DUF4010 family)
VSDAALLDPFFRFAIALFIGALVGVDRERKSAADAERDIAGLRTFILVALAGALAAWLSERFASPWVFAAMGVLLGAVVVAGYAAVAVGRASYGLTTEIAALVVYLLGGLAIVGEPALAVALAIATAAVLAFKQPLHEAVARVGLDDLYAVLTLLICTFIVLPVLPNRPLDPWGALNPFKMWWLVILISGLSLVGYVATRMLGAGRGVPLTGLFGGLVSSTAVTLTFARRSRDEGGGAGAADAFAAGILLAWAVMFARVVVAVALVDPGIVRPLLAPLLTLAILTTAAAAFCYWQSSTPRPAREDVPLRNPFSLSSAIRFALLFAVVLLVVELVQTYFPRSGVYAVSALAGLTDVDAITLSVAASARDGDVAPGTAVIAIVIAALTNTAVKAGFVLSIAAPALKRRTGMVVGLLVAGAVLSLAFS